MAMDTVRSSLPPPPPSRLVRALSVPDFLLRLAFFSTAPIVLFQLALLFPIGGALANVGFILGVFFTASAVRGLTQKRPWLARVFRKPLAFEDHYRTHPPRPFLYYVFFPILFPYWLFDREARREFVVFRGYTVFGLVVLVVSGSYQYFFKWRPELGFGDFFVVLLVVTMIEIVITLSMLMPMATTLVAFHLGGKRKRMAVLVAATAIMTVIMTIAYAKKRHEVVPIPTSIRMVLRTRAEPARSRQVRTKALRAAFRALHYHEGEIDKDSRIESEILGGPIDEARDILGTFYKSDETYCFHLVVLQKGKVRVLVLYGDPNDKREKVIWLGMRGLGEVVDQDDDLPPNAFSIMRKNAKK